MVGEVYRKRLKQKLKFYLTLKEFKFIGFYPKDLKSIKEILTKLKLK